MTQVNGKGNIYAKVVADSISEAGQRITSFELQFHRFILPEFNTHRQFSRNAASSRAIPIEKVIEQVENNPAMPVHWGKNQSGMQAKEELGPYDLPYAQEMWETSAAGVTEKAISLKNVGLHKQIVNRILEPYQMIKVVCTATEYENFFYLRDHADAQPEIAELARCMKEAMDKSEPQLLEAGEWHLPYIGCYNGQYFTTWVEEDNGWANEVSLEEAIKISASLCAQVSYRKSDESLDKALKIYDMLVGMKPVHASPFEHQATPMVDEFQLGVYQNGRTQEGVTHFSTGPDATPWSGNFKGWVQNRQLIKGHVYNG